MLRTSSCYFITVGLLVLNQLIYNTAAAEPPTTSEFIDDLPLLHQSTLIDGLYTWKTPDVSASEYDRFIIEEIDIFIHPDSDYQGINAADVLTMTSALRSSMIDVLEPRYPVVNKPGPGVIRLKMAITGVKLQKREDLMKGAYSQLMIGRALNKSRTPVVQLDDASMELESLDSLSGKRLSVAIDPAALKHGKGKPDWEAMNESFILYAKRIRQRMDATHKK